MLRNPAPLRAFGCAMALAVVALSIPTAKAQTIRNTATLSFQSAAGPQQIASNTVTLDRAKRPTQMRFHQVPAGYTYSANMACQTDPFLQFTPGMVSAAELASTPPLATLENGQELILELDAQGENHDPMRREVAVIDAASESEQIKVALMETGEDTGIFAGAIPASGTNASNRACDIPSRARSQIRIAFGGSETSFDSEAVILIDPEG
jgi:hypothetical protein